MNSFKKNTKSIVGLFANIIVRITSANFLGRYLLDQIVNRVRANTKSVEHNGYNFIFSTPSSLTFYRTETFATKEPETLAWIDSIPKSSVFWDVGANVGLYSCYAAKARKCEVFAFEPSVFNLELLASNIFLNKLTDKVTILPIPLSDEISLSTLNMTTIELGGALSTFGHKYGHDGAPINEIFSFGTIGLSMTDVVEKLKIPQPNYIKIDVDGIEALILKGGQSVLGEIQGLLIEINEEFITQSLEVNKYLNEAGLILISKNNADKESSDSKCYNQIWGRAAF